jgi:hypothetical protein
MTICRFLPADSCSRRADPARAASDRQTSPVRASSERPTGGGNFLTAKVFAVLRAAWLRFLPCFSGENTGETGVPAPLFAARVGVIRSARQTKLACVEAEFPCHSAVRERIFPAGDRSQPPRRVANLLINMAESPTNLVRLVPHLRIYPAGRVNLEKAVGVRCRGRRSRCRIGTRRGRRLCGRVIASTAGRGDAAPSPAGPARFFWRRLCGWNWYRCRHQFSHLPGGLPFGEARGGSGFSRCRVRLATFALDFLRLSEAVPGDGQV